MQPKTSRRLTAAIATGFVATLLVVVAILAMTGTFAQEAHEPSEYYIDAWSHDYVDEWVHDGIVMMASSYSDLIPFPGEDVEPSESEDQIGYTAYDFANWYDADEYYSYEYDYNIEIMLVKANDFSAFDFEEIDFSMLEHDLSIHMIYCRTEGFMASEGESSYELSVSRDEGEFVALHAFSLVEYTGYGFALPELGLPVEVINVSDEYADYYTIKVVSPQEGRTRVFVFLQADVGVRDEEMMPMGIDFDFPSEADGIMPMQGIMPMSTAPVPHFIVQANTPMADIQNFINSAPTGSPGARRIIAFNANRTIDRVFTIRGGRNIYITSNGTDINTGTGGTRRTITRNTTAPANSHHQYRRHFQVLDNSTRLTLTNIILCGGRDPGSADRTPRGGVIVGFVSGGHGAGPVSATATLTLGNNTIIRRNYANRVIGQGGIGGGVYIRGANATLNMRPGSIVENNQGVWGGGVGVSGRGHTFNMTGGIIRNNRALPSSDNPPSQGAGGGVFINDVNWQLHTGQSTFNMSGSSLIEGNTSSGSAGGVWVAHRSRFYMSGSTHIRRNVAGENGNGGGVTLANEARFTMSGGTIGGSVATDGNRAGGVAGGVRVADNSRFDLAGSATKTIRFNQAGTHGGGIQTGGSSQLNIGGTGAVNITDNRTGATHHGGGMYLGGTGALTNTMTTGTLTISRNTAGGNGGGINRSNTHNTTATFNQPVVISDNTAGLSGGGMHLFSAGTFTFGNLIMQNNRASVTTTGATDTTGGGAISMANGTVTMNSGRILSNNVKRYNHI